MSNWDIVRIDTNDSSHPGDMGYTVTEHFNNRDSRNQWLQGARWGLEASGFTDGASWVFIGEGLDYETYEDFLADTYTEITHIPINTYKTTTLAPHTRVYTFNDRTFLISQ
jgi:hypothetical protein